MKNHAAPGSSPGGGGGEEGLISAYVGTQMLSPSDRGRGGRGRGKQMRWKRKRRQGTNEDNLCNQSTVTKVGRPVHMLSCRPGRSIGGPSLTGSCEVTSHEAGA
jgi:hypothetical protein